MTFKSQSAQSLVDSHTQSELDHSKQDEAFYGGGGRGERGEKKSDTKFSMEDVAYILGATLIMVNLAMVSFHFYTISNKQCAVDKAELVDGVEEKYKLVSFDFFLFLIFLGAPTRWPSSAST